ncbi:hypothetical protein HAX54_028822 [Datura stramonium]|uniref:Uncharacterized protein n=1 Tax=Datura stramonium TaxID=4076 RepID=A0ABS8V607_DATST|nr:hypothetical protein [Datura stramonium]
MAMDRRGAGPKMHTANEGIVLSNLIGSGLFLYLGTAYAHSKVEPDLTKSEALRKGKTPAEWFLFEPSQIQGSTAADELVPLRRDRGNSQATAIANGLF